MPLGTLSILKDTIRREGKYRYVDALCSVCKTKSAPSVDNIRAGSTKNCKCQRRRKYEDKVNADILGERFDAMKQRCNRNTHVSSHLYKGRGIMVLFPSREYFIRWCFLRWPAIDLVSYRLDFDRIDNDGHYEPQNLRLVSRRVNIFNTRRSRAKRNGRRKRFRRPSTVFSITPLGEVDAIMRRDFPHLSKQMNDLLAAPNRGTHQQASEAIRERKARTRCRPI